MITKYILLFFLLGFNVSGLFLILLRTGDVDADMFTKILGWILFIPSLITIIYHYKWPGLILLLLSMLITFIIKTYYQKEKANGSSY